VNAISFRIRTSERHAILRTDKAIIGEIQTRPYSSGIVKIEDIFIGFWLRVRGGWEETREEAAEEWVEDEDVDWD
jgi:hypothetical protein